MTRAAEMTPVPRHLTAEAPPSRLVSTTDSELRNEGGGHVSQAVAEAIARHRVGVPSPRRCSGQACDGRAQVLKRRLVCAAQAAGVECQPP